MPGAPGSEPSPLLTALFAVVLLSFAAGDLCILLLWARGRVTGRPLLARRWSVAHVFLSLQAVLGCVVAVSVPGVVLLSLRGPEAPGMVPLFFTVLWPAMVVQQAALVLTPLAFVRLRYGLPAAELGLPARGEWRAALLGALLVLPLVPVIDLLETLSRRCLLEWGTLPFRAAIEQLAREADALAYVEGVRGNPLALTLLGLVIVAAGPVAEEVFFRGFAYRALKERFGAAAGIGLSALFFALVHGNPVAMLPIFAVGLVLAWLYARTGSLAAPIGLHCANNLLALVLALKAPGASLWDRVIP